MNKQNFQNMTIEKNFIHVKNNLIFVHESIIILEVIICI